MQPLDYSHVSKWKWALLGILLIPCWVIAVKFDIDLVNLHFIAQLSHHDLSRVYAQNGEMGRWFYGPFSLVAVYPLGYFSYETVKTFWIFLQTLSYVFFWWAMMGLYPTLWTKKVRLGWLMVFLFSINPIHNNYQSNNIQLMLAAILIYGQWAFESGSKRQQFWSAFFISLASAFKIFPAFMALYYLVAGKRPMQKGLVLGGVFSLLVPFLIFGISSGLTLYQEFYESLFVYTQSKNSLLLAQDIMCLPSLLARLYGSEANAANAIKYSSLVIALSFYAYVAFQTWRNKLNSDLAFALGWILMILLNPSTRPHYYIFAVPAFSYLVQWLYLNTQGKRFIQLSTVLSFTFIALSVDALVGKNLNDRLEALSFPTFGLLLLVVALLTLTWASKNRKPTLDLGFST